MYLIKPSDCIPEDLSEVTLCPRDDRKCTEPLLEYPLCIIGENTGGPKLVCRSGEMPLGACTWT